VRGSDSSHSLSCDHFDTVVEGGGKEVGGGGAVGACRTFEFKRKK